VERVFLLSPAKASGERASVLLREGASFDLARALRSSRGAPVGEVFSFLSGLYFRGKLAYARAFGGPLVITPDRGLIAPESAVRAGDLRAMAGVPIDAREARYREPLERDVAALARRVGRGGEVVLLGSVASGKYVEVLVGILGERLLFPVDFVGRGDMSRGGLLLRCARAGAELPYGPVAGAALHGKRPPKLPPLVRRS
jgi:hypothetical protein